LFQDCRLYFLKVHFISSRSWIHPPKLRAATGCRPIAARSCIHLA
jgi:hypothetical protein